jgi:tRNA-Thr(GGU) m(6)t(6)A37 methyltransferase TsaA
MKNSFTIKQIGTIKRENEAINLMIDDEYRKAMQRIEDFSHVVVFWWAHEADNPEGRAILDCNLPYAEEIRAGVFACRSQNRPNPIAMTVCPILSVDHEKGIITVSEIDAISDSPIIDIKVYFPVLDRVQNCSYPEWLNGWPKWMPEEGIGIFE